MTSRRRLGRSGQPLADRLPAGGNTLFDKTQPVYDGSGAGIGIRIGKDYADSALRRAEQVGAKPVRVVWGGYR